jgi:hypothetical protein
MKMKIGDLEEMFRELPIMLEEAGRDDGIGVSRLFYFTHRDVVDRVAQDSLLYSIIADMIRDGWRPVSHRARSWYDWVTTDMWGTTPEDIAVRMVTDWRLKGSPTDFGETYGQHWLARRWVEPGDDIGAA